MEIKRILAIAGVILLVLLYVSAFVLALMNHPDSGRMLMAAVVSTVFIPVLIHLFLMMNNVRKGKGLYDEPYSYREKGTDLKGEDKDGSIT